MLSQYPPPPVSKSIPTPYSLNTPLLVINLTGMHCSQNSNLEAFYQPQRHFQYCSVYPRYAELFEDHKYLRETPPQ
jgi:hypothetical protein